MVRKIVLAPFGSDSCGVDILLFEHGLFFALELAFEAASVAFADVHSQLGGPEKKDRPTQPLADSDIRALAARSACDVFVDGMLQVVRDPETGALAQVIVAPRIFVAATAGFEYPDAIDFRAFSHDAKPEQLELDYELYIAIQYRLCDTIAAYIGLELPRSFTADSLMVTPSWEAYSLFLKGKRMAGSAETKLGYYEQAIRRDPAFFLALYNSAMLYKTQTDYHTARSRLMKAASTAPDDTSAADVYFELGLTSIYLGDPKTARNFWERALELGADNPALYVNMAGTYEQEENWAEAKRLNRLALDRFPDHHKAIVNLARLHAMFGQLDEAIPLYERALELEPNDALRHSVLGGCLLAAGRPADARPHFERAAELDPDSDPGKYAAQELDKLDHPRR